MPGSIESYGRGHTRGESAKRHFHRLSTITRSDKPYRFFDLSPAAIRDCVVTRQALYSLVTESIGCDVNGAASRMPLPNAHGLQPKRDGSVLQRSPKRFELFEVHAVDDGVAHDSGSLAIRLEVLARLTKKYNSVTWSGLGGGDATPPLDLTSPQNPNPHACVASMTQARLNHAIERAGCAAGYAAMAEVSSAS